MRERPGRRSPPDERQGKFVIEDRTAVRSFAEAGRSGVCGNGVGREGGNGEGANREGGTVVPEGTTTFTGHRRWGTLTRRMLQTGGVLATDEECVIGTVLGSCVCVCLHDPVRRAGGMNHFLLPDGDGGRGQETRFGVQAMEVLINELMHLGGQRARLVAKVFGGGRVLGSLSRQDPGGHNAAFALDFLEREAIPVVSSLLCLSQPLEVNFLPLTGKVFVKRLRLMGIQQVEVHDEQYRRQLRRVESGDGYGDVTLF